MIDLYMSLYFSSLVPAFKMATSGEMTIFILTLCFVYSLAETHSHVRRSFATKSRYPMYTIDDDISKTPEGCTPLHINMVFRHGTRYPGKKDIKGMTELADYINQFHKEQTTFKNLKLPWHNRFKYGDKYLAKVGAEELYNISKRLLRKYPSLFTPKYFGEQHYFVSTQTPRASQSASAFAFGLFEGTGYLGPSKFQPVAITTTNLTEPVLRFFDTCSEYKQKVSKNKKISLAEFHMFKEGQEMLDLKRELGNRLNIPEYSSLTSDHIQNMFLSCAYELAIYGKGEWCSILEESEIDVIEYLYDIKNYWKRGYGYKINYEMSCLLLKNLTQSMENIVVQSLYISDFYTKAIFHFAHAETIIPLICLMGLFKDTEPLLANNYHEQKERLFKTSNIAPFSANVAVVLFSCKKESNIPSFYVQVLVNEKPVALPCCDKQVLCSLGQFRTCFRNIIKQCDFSKMCNNQNSQEPNHNEL